MISRRHFGLAAVAAMVPGAIQADEERLAGQLRYLKGALVKVAPLPTAVSEKGVLDADLTTDVELRLRQAGFRIYTKEEWPKVPGMPEVFASVTFLIPSIARPPYIFSANFGVLEFVSLKRYPAPSSVSAWIWDDATIRSTNDLADVRQSVRDLTDRFVNQWLADNPKK